MNDTVQLFPGDGRAPQNTVKIQDPETFDIHLKSGNVIRETGYLALGHYVAVLERPNDSLSVVFATLADNVDFVQQTDEIEE